MAILPTNSLFNGMRGTMGDLVFKTRNGRTYVSQRPQRKERTATEGQAKVQEEFSRCVDYAKKAMEDPAIKKLYTTAAKKGKSAYNVAFADAFKAPEISKIHTQGYKGRKEDIILIEARDDFKVAKVEVALRSAAGELIEKGSAVSENGRQWIYIVTQSNKKYIGCFITATATDLPGNKTSLKVERLSLWKKIS